MKIGAPFEIEVLREEKLRTQIPELVESFNRPSPSCMKPSKGLRKSLFYALQNKLFYDQK
jgi:hypothetical protein